MKNTTDLKSVTDPIVFTKEKLIAYIYRENRK